MNEEYKRGWISTIKMLLALIIGTLWWLAGRGCPITRKALLPLIIALECYIFQGIQTKKWDFKVLGLYTGMFAWYWASMSLFSYGAGSWLRPLGIIPQRIIVGLMWSIPALPVAVINKRWTVYGLHILLFTITMTVLGSFSILTAAAEEAIIGLMFALFVPFIIGYSDV